MSSMLKEDIRIVQTLDQFLDDDYAITFELSLFVSNIEKEVCGVFDSFLSFLRKYEEREVDNTFSLILDPQFKGLRQISSFVGCEQNNFIIEKYDEKEAFTAYAFEVLSSLTSCGRS